MHLPRRYRTNIKNRKIVELTHLVKGEYIALLLLQKFVQEPLKTKTPALKIQLVGSYSIVSTLSLPNVFLYNGLIRLHLE